MRRGLTLIELIVVAAVVGLSLALLMPAVGAAQRKAGQASCVNNLKQIGLALHNYHSTNDAFPMSQTLGTGHGVGQGAYTQVLPYMELSPLYNAYNFTLEDWHAANTTAARTTVATFLCPENERRDPVIAKDVFTLDGKPLPGGDTFGRNHYGVNWGGGHEGYGDDFVKTNGTCVGLIVPVATKDSKGVPTRNIRFADVTDGLSYTLSVVEKQDGSGWAVGGWSGTEFDVAESPAYDGKDAKKLRVFTGSPHERGPYGLMGDGSVRPLSPKIDRAVWYALITRAHNEIIKSGSF